MTTETRELAATFINPNAVPGMWGHLKPMLEEACGWSAGQFDLRSVVNGILDGEFTLLCVMDGDKPLAALVLAISEFKTGKRVLEVLLASGSNLKDWLQFEGALDSHARQFGATEIRMIGREGLQRMLPKWKRLAVVMGREIGDG